MKSITNKDEKTNSPTWEQKNTSSFPGEWPNWANFQVNSAGKSRSTLQDSGHEDQAL